MIEHSNTLSSPSLGVAQPQDWGRLQRFSTPRAQPAGHAAERKALIDRAWSARACWLGIFGADALALAVAAWTAGRFAALSPFADNVGGESGQHQSMLSATAFFVCLVIGVTVYVRLVDHAGARARFLTECRNVTAASCAGLLLICALAFVFDLRLARPPLAAFAVVFPPVAILLQHAARYGLSRAGVWRIPVVVIGGDDSRRFVETGFALAPYLGYDVVAAVSPADFPSPAPGQAWSTLLRAHGARLVVLASDAEQGSSQALLGSLARANIPHARLQPNDGFPVSGHRQEPVGADATLVTYRNAARRPIARGVKLLFDIAAAGLMLAALAPVMMLVAMLIKADGGPVFFSHPRIGAGGRVFRCLKFRSMTVDSDAVLQALLASDPAAREEWERTHKLRRDPRITWVGRILRKTSLDELPQLLNVLRLDMSLVGPRPIVAQEVQKYAENIAYYYEMRPGITGLWQVSGRSDTTYALRVELDSFYTKNWSLWHDVTILARTVPAVISGRGAG